jgi:hypothetical protein
MNEKEKIVEALLEDYPALEDAPDLLKALADGRVEVTQHSEGTGHRRVRVGIVRESGFVRDDAHHAFARDTGIPDVFGPEVEGFVADVDLGALVENELADGWTWVAVEEVEKA